MSGLADFAAARWPWRGTGAGPLAGLLLALTVVTGMVDAVSCVALGHVFVANMTGNVVFLGFALAGVSAAGARGRGSGLTAAVTCRRSPPPARCSQRPPPPALRWPGNRCRPAPATG